MKVTLEFGKWYDRVEVDGRELDPARSLKVWNHSPGGFAWGYMGSGPAQLALALLLEAGLSEKEAVRLHQSFKKRFVAAWATDGDYVVDVQAWARDNPPKDPDPVAQEG